MNLQLNNFMNKKAQLGNFVNRYDGMIILALVIHYLVKWPLGFDVRITFYFDILYAVIVWFLIFPPEQRTRQTFVTMLIVFSLEVFLRGLPGISDGFAHLNFTRYLLNPLFTPWWVIYGIVINPGGTFFSFVFRWGLIAYLLSILFLAMGNMPAIFKSEVVGPEQEQAVLKFWDNAKKFWKDMLARLDLAVRNLKIRVQMGLSEASGGYYQGKVEQNRYEPLGVYLEDLKVADPEFDRSEPTVILGTLKVKTLEDGVNVRLGCYKGKKENKEKIGRMNPQQEVVYDLEELPIDCTFDPYVLEQGAQSITLGAEYNFETQGYLKSYFIDKERLRAFQRRNIDPLEQFGITDKQPIAIYTNGPIKLGMGLEKQPVAIAIDTETRPRLGITIENQPTWKGKIKQLNGLIIQLPENLDIEWCSHPVTLREPSQCASDFKQYKTKQYINCLKKTGIEEVKDFDKLDSDNSKLRELQQNVDKCLQETCATELEGYKEYNFNINTAEPAFQNIEVFKTFTCRLKAVDIDKLLGTDPIKTIYVRTKARYTYEVEDSIMVRVKQVGTTTNFNMPLTTDSEKLKKLFNQYYIQPQPDRSEPPLNTTYPIEYITFDSYEPAMCLLMSLMIVKTGGDSQYIGSEGNCKGIAGLCKNVVQNKIPNGYLQRVMDSLKPGGKLVGLNPTQVNERLITMYYEPNDVRDTPLCDLIDCTRQDYRISNISKSMKGAAEYLAYLKAITQKYLESATELHQGAAVAAAYLSGEFLENNQQSIDHSMIRVIGRKLIEPQFIQEKVELTLPSLRHPFEQPSNFFEWLASNITIPQNVRITGDELKDVDKYKTLSDKEREEVADKLSYQLVMVAKLNEECNTKHLVKRGMPKDPSPKDVNHWNSTNSTLTNPRRVIEELSNAAVNMTFDYQQLPDGRVSFSLSLERNGVDKPLSSITLQPREIKPDKWYWRNYPFFQFMFNGKTDITQPILGIVSQTTDETGATVPSIVEDKIPPIIRTNTADIKRQLLGDNIKLVYSKSATVLTLNLVQSPPQGSTTGAPDAGAATVLSTVTLPLSTIEYNKWYDFAPTQFKIKFPATADTSKINVRTMKRSVIEMRGLYEEDRKGLQEDDSKLVPVWDMLKVRYTDPYLSGQNVIEVYTDKDQWPGRLCEVPWGIYPVYETCRGLDTKQNQLPGFIVRNLKKEDHGARVVATQPHSGQVLVDYTDVQFEFNPQYIEFE